MSTQKSNTRPRTPSLLRKGGVAVLATLSLGALSACGEDEAPTQSTLSYNASLTAFDSCDTLDGYIVDAATEAFVSAYTQGGYYRNDVDFAEAPTSDAGGGPGSAPPADSPDEFTGTNNQEVGVDESDMVKTDGVHTYVLQDNTVHVLKAWPAEEMHEVSQIELSGYGDQMFLADDRLVVFTYVYTGDGRYDGGWGVPEPMPDSPDDEPGDVPVDPLDDGTWFSGTRVAIYDVSNPEAPSQTALFDVEGNFVSARMVDGEVYLVSRSTLFDTYSSSFYELANEVELPTLDWDATEEERSTAADALREDIRPIIEAYVADQGRSALIPDIRTSADDRADLFTCGQMMRPAASAGLSVLSVIGFDPTDGVPSGVGVIADGWQVYGSQQSIYVAQDSRWWNWGSPSDAFAATHIHKFALNSGSPVYQASGEVDGWLLDQFSMSEHDGVLRVATTDQTNWGWGTTVDVAEGGGAVGGDTIEPSDPPRTDGATPDSADKTITELREDTSVDANNVFTLRQDGNALEVIGGIQGIAPGEQIFAVRFLGDTGYVVTFEQVDPLFVVDLSTPETPVLRGELKIPGYSGYLHPMGEDHLIGIGRDGTDEGQILGVQISLFDVSNPEDPQRVDEYALSHGDGFYGWSEAEHDHHAFTFYESRGLLAIPVTLEDYGWDDDSYSHFSGLVVFEIDEDGIEEFGRVSHTMMAHDRYCGDIDESDPEPVEACSSYDYPWWVNMRRSIFADDYLYAISNMGVTASSLDGLDDVLAEVRY